MGLNLFKRSCSSCTPTSNSVEAVAPNPNPGRFKVIWVKQIGQHALAKIRYLDCTNFEGVKLCVYRNTPFEKILDSVSLDPHFAEHGLAPFARFEPTPDGEAAARKFAQML